MHDELVDPPTNTAEQATGQRRECVREKMLMQGALAEAVTGIYLGWASIGGSKQVYKMVMSIGFNPYYNNTEKAAEPWLLHTFEQDFYDEELRLLVCGYIRPEANFESLEALVQRIHEDAAVTKAALTDKTFAAYEQDAFLAPQDDSA